MATCPRCKERERAAGQAWCRGCLTEYQRERRARLRRERPATVVCAECRRKREALAVFLREVDKGMLARLGKAWNGYYEVVK